MDDNEQSTQIELLKARIEELAEALAFTNEKLNKFATDQCNMTIEDGRIWLKLNLKKIESMTRDEIKALNEEVYHKYLNRTVRSKEAVKQPTYDEQFESLKYKEDKGYDDAIVYLAKKIVSDAIEYEQSNGILNNNEASG